MRGEEREIQRGSSLVSTWTGKLKMIATTLRNLQNYERPPGANCEELGPKLLCFAGTNAKGQSINFPGLLARR